MKFTISNNRQVFEGDVILLQFDEIKIGDYISTCRHDKNNKLEVFFKVEKIKPLGVHEKVLLSNDEQYMEVPYYTEYRIIRLDK